MDKSELLNQLRIERSPPPPTRWRWAGVALCVLAAGAYLSFRLLRPVRSVRVVEAQVATALKSDSAVLDATGYVTARRQATVSAKITGRVEEIFIEEGQVVAAGAVMARLDPIDAQAQLGFAHAQVAAAQALLADLRVQAAQAKRDAERQRTLARRQLTSTQIAETAQLQVDSLAARIDSQRRQVTVAERAVTVAEVGLDNTIVRAPFAGVVTVKAAQPGEIVSPMSAGGGFTRTGIGTLVDMDSLEIEVDVNEAYISRVEPRQPVSAVLNAYPTWNIPAHVITIIPAADRSKATVKVRIAIDIRDLRIVPDMGIRVSFLEDPKKPSPTPVPLPGVMVPADALVHTDEGTVAFLLEGEHVRRQQVTLGQTLGSQRQILSGIPPHARVVSAPPAGLTDGQRIILDAR